jgi:hypothetical protein
MANKIYMNVLGTDISFSAVCTEDIQVQAQSQFTRIGDFVPSIDNLVTIANVTTNGIAGRTSSGMINLKNALDIPIWQKTEPVKIVMDMNFFIQTSGYYDVWLPTMTLQSMNILSKDLEGGIITPGFNLDSIGKASSIINTGGSLKKDQLKYLIADMFPNDTAPQASDFTNSKLCSVYIPSIVYLPIAIVENLQVTWSKQLSSKGYSIWSKVNVQFTGAISAIFEDNFLSVNPDIAGVF